ncbi:hypothetical protein [Mycolicibacterium aubagnense]|uniref:Uncharacterized protein n=1 Tax=Mycolicibacterium aubagnense TaxID=319707 RepID=A0ABM7IHY2_9MYCO|nr:hypothetical protein [Mycolicibacterium aubagnense]WGI32088.1 hypothetical protein QDT91_23260 [Mycolicibacterium aubagnense]BBX86380.1 hypothetical protein MAUB_42530 [Mycolicibacterium aubagnense]
MPNASSFITGLLQNSTTSINRATYVPLAVAGGAAKDSTRAATKANFVASLQLQPGDVQAVQGAHRTVDAAKAGPAPTEPFWSLLQQFEGTPMASSLPAVSAFADVAPTHLTAFSDTLKALRQQTVDRLRAADPAGTSPELGAALIALNAANVASQALASNLQTSEVGMLNLERLEMTPAGIERGGLISTIPLAPKERTFVVQKEWSVTTQEFTSIVTDSLDNFSETGVTENTQMTQATTSQVAHSNQFNVTASASGGIGFVSGSTTTSFGTQDSNSASAAQSRQASVQTTRLASSRVRQSHKTTISTTTTVGTSNATSRRIENPSDTEPMRIDYYSMMRKWYVALYRYGLRMTYDITVPEPGAMLRWPYAWIDFYQKQLGQAFVFPHTHASITPANYLSLADKYSADVPAPPSPDNHLIDIGPVTNSVTDKQFPAPFNVPDGYWIENIYFTHWQGDTKAGGYPFTLVGGPTLTSANQGKDICAGGHYLYHQTGAQTLVSFWDSSSQEGDVILYFRVICKPTAAAMAQWQAAVWTALYNAAQQQYYTQQAGLSAQITAIQNSIANVDTLTLRREENDEIMRCVLKWLLGPQINFAFMPPSVQKAFLAAAVAAGDGVAEYPYGIDFADNQSTLTPTQWAAIGGEQQMISFINEAIEWENVTYFTYSYFWDYPGCWNFIRNLQHDDKTRQAFLRAGSARVVLTVRKGWEAAWAYFVYTGVVPPNNDPQLPALNHPYMTIAQQIAAYDDTNYPGIPAANPDGGGLVDDGTPQTGTTCRTNIQGPSSAPVEIPVDDATDFVAGASLIIDTWDSHIDPSTGLSTQETQTITAVTKSPASITVVGLKHSHTGPFPVVQAGAKGTLIGEWFEYTPTSGTDIDVVFNPPTDTVA